jgi:hypothetical protein
MKIDQQRVIGLPPNPTVPTDMEQDDGATVRSGNSGKNGPEMKEYHVKWCFGGITDKIKAQGVYSDILANILEAHADDLTILTHDREEFAWSEDRPETELKHLLRKSKLPIHAATSKGDRKLQRWYGVHTIRSTASFSEVKNHYLVQEIIQEYKAYGTIHRFDLKEWDIAHLGFLQGYNNIHLSPQFVEERIKQSIASTSDSRPVFHIANSRIRPAKSTKLSNVSTQAYEVQCVRSDASKMNKLLTSGTFRTTMAFVPYAYKQTQPDMFLNAIRLHKQKLEDTWIVKIHGFSTEEMIHCQHSLIAHAGVSDIVPSYLGKSRGEWKILLSKNSIHEYYSWLTHSLPDILALIPKDCSTSTEYPPKGINSRPPAAQQDDVTQADEDSYATMLSNAMSCATADFPAMEFEIPPDIDTSTPPTYAAAAASTHMSDLTSARKSTTQQSKTTSKTQSESKSTPTQNPPNDTSESDKEIKLLRSELEKLHTTVESQQQHITQQLEKQQAENTELKAMIQLLLAATSNTNPPQQPADIPLPPRIDNISAASNKRQATMETPERIKNPTVDSTTNPDTSQVMEE